MSITKSTTFAHAKEVICMYCHGTGESPDSGITINKCTTCEGTGKIVRVVRGTVELMTVSGKRAFPA